MPLRVDLTRIARRAPELAREAMLETAADITDVAKQIAPVDTGALRQSIGAVPDTPNRVMIGTDRIYGKYVEYGTSRSAAQPFLTPAFAQAKATFQARIAQKMKELE